MAKPQSRVTLNGSSKSPLPSGQDLGPADPNQSLEVTLLLRRHRSPDPANFASNSLHQRRYLTRAEFARSHGATSHSVQRVRDFADQYNLKITQENLPARLIKLSGTVQSFHQAFGVDLHHYRDASRTFRCRSGPLTIPSDLQDIVQGVFGLDNRPQAKAHFRIRKPSPNVAHAATISYSPLQVAQAYNFPPNTDGTGQCIAILELGGGYNPSDLNNFFENLGVPLPKVTAVSIDGAANSPTGDPNGADGEVELDIEVAGAIAPGAQIAAYFAPNTDQGFIDALSTAIHDAKLKPSIISISWGGPETSWTAQARVAFNSACEDAAAMGATVIVAAGDDGATDNSPDGSLTVDFPASSPNVLSCGGTRLSLSGNSISSEQVWNDLATSEGGTGGGVSQAFAIPDYQKTANVPKAPNGFAGRGVPDVAGNADPATGYTVLVDGKQAVIGGTSAVAPLWAALLARINQSLGSNVGFVNPLLYSASEQQSFRDITTGNNGSYPAGPGWDACTGLGSPNGTALLAALRNNPGK